MLESKQEQEPKLSAARATNVQKIYSVTDGIDSAQTRAVYLRNFNRFLNQVKTHDLQVLLDFSPKVIKQMIVDYILYLRKREVKRDSIKTQVAAILHFFHNNIDDFPLDIKKFKRDLPPDETVNEDRPYTTEEIAQVVKDCDPRTRVAILLLCSSGIRIGALSGLQIGDLLDIPTKAGVKLYKIQVYARTRDKYTTFCTPECASVINDYLDYRRRSKEEIKDKSPLIREQFNAENPFTINAPKFVSDRGIEYIITHALKRSGVRKPREVHMSHGFRKFFMSNAEQVMKSINVKILMGHDIGVSKAYYHPKEQEVLEDYCKAINQLTIDHTNRMQNKVAELENQQSKEIEALKKELNTFKRIFVASMNSQRNLLEKQKSQKRINTV
jgi:integrase